MFPNRAKVNLQGWDGSHAELPQLQGRECVKVAARRGDVEHSRLWRRDQHRFGVMRTRNRESETE